MFMEGLWSFFTRFEVNFTNTRMLMKWNKKTTNATAVRLLNKLSQLKYFPHSKFQTYEILFAPSGMPVPT